jgi:hypothetical protein
MYQMMSNHSLTDGTESACETRAKERRKGNFCEKLKAWDVVQEQRRRRISLALAFP